MVFHIIIITFILFIENISASIYKKENDDTTTNIKNAIQSIKNDLIDEQTKTSAESYDGENLDQISTSGNYHYTGEITTTITVQKNSGIVHLYLENAKFSSPGEKIIDSKNGVNLIITLIGENTISNPSETSTNAITTNQDITINGQGSLTITSSKNGIKSDGKFYGFGGTITILSKNHGINSDSLYLDGININIEETGDGKDGLHAETDYDGVSEVPSFDFLKGFIFIESGTINIKKIKGDGIKADSFVYIVGGNINIDTIAIWETFVATSSRMKGCFSKNGDTYLKVPTDNVRKGVTYYILSESCKGIKVGEIDYYLKDDESQTEQIVESSLYTTLIEGGIIKINSPDDSIHTNSGTTFIDGGQIQISTLDDGIHADLNLIINNGDIDIETCFEGLEAQTIEIKGGNTKIISDDDGINAAGDKESQLLFSGGKTYVYAKGDGLDSNGNLVINDGEIYVLQNGRGDGQIDSERDIIINGGKLVAVSANGMTEIPSSSSKQCVIVRQIASTSDDLELKKTNSDEILLNFEISSIFGVKVSYSIVTVSSSSIKMCRSYDIVTGLSINSLVTSGSSTVTSNLKPGFGWGGGNSGYNDGDNCPDVLPTDEIESNNNEASSTITVLETSYLIPDINDDNFNEDSANNKGLSKGAIIGIAVSCSVVAVLVVAFLIYFLIIKRRKIHTSKDEELFSQLAQS